MTTDRAHRTRKLLALDEFRLWCSTARDEFGGEAPHEQLAYWIERYKQELSAPALAPPADKHETRH